MRFLLLLVFVVGLLGCSPEERPENGVYVSPKEVFPIHSEILELRNGRYQYWMQADVGAHKPIEMAGEYTRQGDRILISGNRRPPFDRLLVEDRGEFRLLRYDSEEMWTKGRTYVPYGTLSRVPYTFSEMTPARDFDKAKWEVLLRKLPVLDRPE
jgi:hypothetical protein